MARRKGAIRRLREAALLVLDAAPPHDWPLTKWRPADETVISGEIEAVAFEAATWTGLLRIQGRWLPINHARLEEAIREVDPEIGENILIYCFGKKGNAYQYRVEVGDRAWP